MIRKLIKSKVFLIFIALFVLLFVRHMINENKAYYLPEYPFEEVSFSSGEDEIFKYTGLSPRASSDIFESKKLSQLYKLNKLYFEKPEIEKEYILYPTTAQESVKAPIPLAPLCDGDILYTPNTHTLDWRHGHTAIVTDAEKGIILEHMSIGNTTVLSYAEKWGNYPAFAILRYPDEKTAKKAVEFAKEKLTDVPYSIFAGLIEKDKSKNDEISSSHCSHIVWQAYKAVGVDLDSNGGRIVTPKDVAKSDKLKLVQIFGLNPKDFNGGLMK